MQNLCAVALCAGDGKRMKSAHPKVLCKVLFRPMVAWIAQAVRDSGIQDLCLVCGDQAGKIQEAVPGTEIALQTQRKGTGHAVKQAKEFLLRHQGGSCLVVNGDAPFISAQVIREALEYHQKGRYAMTLITASLENPFGYGRVVRDASGGLQAIVEQTDADEAVRQIKEVNSGAYWFEVDFLLRALESLTPQNQQGEYYLTDTAAYVVKQGEPAGVFCCGDPDVILGANDRAGLLRLNEVARRRELEKHLANGVEILCADGVVIAPGVEIGRDTCILPGTILRGNTVIGCGCTIGPNTILEDVTVGDETVINSCQAFQSVIGSSVRLGPYSYVRPGCRIADHVKVGDFVELKNSSLGEKTSVAHLTYIGDCDFGARINVGGGIITCNYDGKNKYRSTVEDDAFLGCNTNLVSPVTIGKGAYIAAGSTITQDVPEESLAVGRARQVTKPGWMKQHGEKYRK